MSPDQPDTATTPATGDDGPPATGRLVWLDLEMTGLDPEVDTIIEIATIVTDDQLEVLAEGPVIAIHQPDDVLARMDEWNTTHHGASGLTERVRQSTVDMATAEAETLAFLRQWVQPGTSPLCGNTIGQDRRFMVRYMQALEGFVHYRSIDVSTVKELVRRWQPALLDGFTKQNRHLALDDIRESIEELRYYRGCAFRI